MKERILTTKPESVVGRQNNNYGCAFCTLEYLTGIPRDEIAKDIGHDGSDIINPELPIPKCYAAICSNESLFWLFNKGYQPTELVTRECYQDQQNFYNKRHYPRRYQIAEMLNGKAAELTVFSNKFPDSNHAVAYLDGIVLDPRDGCVHELNEYSIVSVIFTNIDPIARLKEIYDAQPKESVISDCYKSASYIEKNHQAGRSDADIGEDVRFWTGDWLRVRKQRKTI